MYEKENEILSAYQDWEEVLSKEEQPGGLETTCSSCTGCGGGGGCGIGCGSCCGCGGSGGCSGCSSDYSTGKLDYVVDAEYLF